MNIPRFTAEQSLCQNIGSYYSNAPYYHLDSIGRIKPMIAVCNVPFKMIGLGTSFASNCDRPLDPGFRRIAELEAGANASENAAAECPQNCRHLQILEVDQEPTCHCFPDPEKSTALLPYKIICSVSNTYKCVGRPPEPDPSPETTPVRRTNPSFGEQLGGWLLILAGAALVVGTIAEDVITLGAGIADDPASLAASAELIRRGAQLIR